MPAKSKAQFRLMQSAANNPAVAKKTGISKGVASEFISATKSPKKLPERKKDGGLYENIHKKRERIAGGSGEKMRKVGSEGAPTAKDFRQAAKTAKMKNGGPSLAVGRGEKMPVERGAGLTAKGREKYNRETGSNLKAPQPQGGPRKDSFCARMEPVARKSDRGSRARASMKRWNCPGW
jgi:hypothetical protein